MSVWPLLLLGGWFTLLLILERSFPARKVPAGQPRRLARNVALALLSLAVSPLILMGTAQLGSTLGPVVALDALMPPALVLPAKLLALDLWTYWAHRWAHVVPAMWRLHAVHHLDAHLDVSSAVRFHVLDVALGGALRTIPAFLLGVTPLEMLTFETLLIAAAAFHHSNLRLPEALERPLSAIVTTPRMHRLHHHDRRADTDSNYTSILSLWDAVFGSRNRGRWRADMAIGVEGEAERELGGLLAYPFEPTRAG